MNLNELRLDGKLVDLALSDDLSNRIIFKEFLTALYGEEVGEQYDPYFIIMSDSDNLHLVNYTKPCELNFVLFRLSLSQKFYYKKIVYNPFSIICEEIINFKHEDVMLINPIGKELNFKCLPDLKILTIAQHPGILLNNLFDTHIEKLLLFQINLLTINRLPESITTLFMLDINFTSYPENLFNLPNINKIYAKNISNDLISLLMNNYTDDILEIE